MRISLCQAVVAVVAEKADAQGRAGPLRRAPAASRKRRSSVVLFSVLHDVRCCRRRAPQSELIPAPSAGRGYVRGRGTLAGTVAGLGDGMERDSAHALGTTGGVLVSVGVAVVAGVGVDAAKRERGSEGEEEGVGDHGDGEDGHGHAPAQRVASLLAVNDTNGKANGEHHEEDRQPARLAAGRSHVVDVRRREGDEGRLAKGRLETIGKGGKCRSIIRTVKHR